MTVLVKVAWMVGTEAEGFWEQMKGESWKKVKKQNEQWECRVKNKKCISKLLKTLCNYWNIWHASLGWELKVSFLFPETSSRRLMTAQNFSKREYQILLTEIISIPEVFRHLWWEVPALFAWQYHNFFTFTVDIFHSSIMLWTAFRFTLCIFNFTFSLLSRHLARGMN